MAVLNSCSPFSRLADLAYSRRLEELYWIRNCKVDTNYTDELFILILANYYVPSDDLTRRMVELGVCSNPDCGYDSIRTVVHCDIPIFAKIEAMIIAGCNSIFQSSNTDPGSGSSNTYPTKSVTYTSTSDDNTSFIVNDTIDKRVIAVIRAISPLKDNQWFHTPSTGRVDLTNGATGLSDGESAIILYEDIP